MKFLNSLFAYSGTACSAFLFSLDCLKKEKFKATTQHIWSAWRALTAFYVIYRSQFSNTKQIDSLWRSVMEGRRGVEDGLCYEGLPKLLQ